jgi:alkylation response protein AidB-like acyl-CoA dehydrogenase
LDFRFSAQEEAFQKEIRDFILAEVPQELRWREREAFTDALWPAMLEARGKLAKMGWATIHWPTEYGGQGASPVAQMLIREEMAYWGAPQAFSFDDGPNLIGPSIIQFGSEHLKSTHLPPIARAETFWCQGYTEPGGGSDLASVHTTAVRDGDYFVINGQKDYCAGAARADWIHILARTNPQAPRHRDISCFVIDMRSPGITLRALDEAHGRSGMLNEVFFDDTRVPAENVVGDVDGGWHVAMSTLERQRPGIEGVGRARALLEDLVTCARATAHQGRTLFDSPQVRGKLGELAVDIEACRLAAYRVAWLQEQGHSPTYQASMSKLLTSEMWQRFANAALQVLGLYGTLEPDSRAAPLQGRIAEAYVGSVAETIVMGTSEIQRNIIAQRGLGLPRE